MAYRTNGTVLWVQRSASAGFSARVHFPDPAPEGETLTYGVTPNADVSAEDYADFRAALLGGGLVTVNDDGSAISSIKTTKAP